MQRRKRNQVKDNPKRIKIGAYDALDFEKFDGLLRWLYHTQIHGFSHSSSPIVVLLDAFIELTHEAVTELRKEPSELREVVLNKELRFSEQFTDELGNPQQSKTLPKHAKKLQKKYLDLAKDPQLLRFFISLQAFLVRIKRFQSIESSFMEEFAELAAALPPKEVVPKNKQENPASISTADVATARRKRVATLAYYRRQRKRSKRSKTN